MNPTDLSNALIYGIPLITCIGYGYESLMACRGRLLGQAPVTPPSLESDGNLSMLQRNGLQLSVADSKEQRTAARDLVRRRYAWRGYETAESTDRTSKTARSANEITFIVQHRRTTVGTVTLGLDGPQGLLAELTHDQVIAEIRRSGRKVCELTRLAIAESADFKSVLGSLLGLAHYVGRSMHAVTDVFIEVNPRHVSFYSRVLGFVVAASEKVCERVHAPSVLLRLELDALEDRLQRAGMGQMAVPFAQAA
jgi:N-acyl amino acid synthase FeeM